MVTDRIVASLEGGIIPWRKPWNAGAGAPRNYISGHVYQSINAFLLSLTPYEHPLFLTYKQAQAAGGQVRKGEKGMMVVFFSHILKENQQTGEKDTFPLLRYSTVFNVAQIDGIDWMLPELQTRDHQPHEEAERICAHYMGELDGPSLYFKGEQALYRKSVDEVLMPAPETFNSVEGYYATLFHELAHSTGHQRRLNRPELVENAGFGSPTYAKEELTAEMTAAFLSAAASLDLSATIENATAYIQNWLNALKNDKTLVMKAASLAQKAAYHILGQAAPSYEATPAE
ncbi:ssDNA-binding domain-containing protein [Hymenobacter sp. J193]|uniref:ArdC family protein n=1 Tax=Hymenobacter sp. J193 TaxID=2898429 RepID=UPI00215167DF|nr:zincin-like metallopeptidase domain-containing protein [Hymenobacter sp. J193]MCR5890384.1 ssDNA-binding domain-containing protein [Hymenobacter sp. J193]